MGKGRLMPWAVVMTKPNCENIADANLRRQGYTSYLPRFKTIRLDKTIFIRPLFPRYLFAYITDRWYSIRSTYGVSYLLSGDDGPLLVPQNIIDELKAREENGYIVLQQKEKFNKGQYVKATDGPLVGKLLIYEGMTTRERVKVLISMLGREVPAVIPEKNLIAA
jgi:transcription antitermination factor NusG